MNNRDNSSNLIAIWTNWVDEFGSFTQKQDCAKPEQDFDKEYFEGEWRHGHESYTLESRRKIEGKNPSLIKETFNPSKVLDAGCGPGFLVLMLKEIGIDAIGIDASPQAVQSAPDEIKKLIHIGSVLDIPFDDKQFDLVISREVLEHLTVIEVAKTVRELCRVSSKYVYVTTRFAQTPKSIFDVETEFDADPTHITCMTQPLLRALFVLEGFKVRKDLENSMDWLDKKRVLVFERTNKALT